MSDVEDNQHARRSLRFSAHARKPDVSAVHEPRSHNCRDTASNAQGLLKTIHRRLEKRHGFTSSPGISKTLRVTIVHVPKIAQSERRRIRVHSRPPKGDFRLPVRNTALHTQKTKNHKQAKGRPANAPVSQAKRPPH